jgi:hypothetical protein
VSIGKNRQKVKVGMRPATSPSTCSGPESFDVAQDHESFDVAQDHEPVEWPVERPVEGSRVEYGINKYADLCGSRYTWQDSKDR